MVGSYELDNESSGSVRGGEFLEYVNDTYLLNKDSAL